jgi:hypothetical protein
MWDGQLLSDILLAWLTVSVKVCFYCFSMEKASTPLAKTCKASVCHTQKRKTKKRESYRLCKLTEGGNKNEEQYCSLLQKNLRNRKELLVSQNKKVPFCEMNADGTIYP